MNTRHVISFAEARDRKSRNPQSRWASVAGDFAGEVWPRLQPSFRIRRSETVFTIGSCFARNIESHLRALGCRVPMRDLHLPPEEWHGAPYGAMNKFHPPAFQQCLEWTAAIRDRDGVVTWADCEALAFDCGNDQFVDLDLCAQTPVTGRRLLERRQHIFDVFSTAFSASCLMMTPGLIEAWRDRATGLYLQQSPRHRAMLAVPERWELVLLSYEDCLQAMLGAIDLVRARNPDVTVLVTTSPVPMSATFSGQDIRIANAYSKSVLRAVCGAVSLQRPLVDYFPSYESVTQSSPAGVWHEDRMHVLAGFVGKIVSRMLDHYLEGVDEATRAYQKAKSDLLNKAFGEAETAARTTLQAVPGHAGARLVLAEALLELGRFDEAEAEIRPLLDETPDQANLWFLMARALIGAGRVQETLDCVERGAALPSVTLTEFRRVAKIMRRHASLDTNERLARRMVELFPLHVDAHRNLAKILVYRGQKANAIEVMKEMLPLRRSNAEDAIGLANLLFGEGRVQEAKVALKAARSLEPDHPGIAEASAAIAAGRKPRTAAAARA